MDLPVSPSGQTDKDMRLSWGESQSVLSSRMCPSGWTYRSALPGKQIASHGVSHRASSLAGCVLLDGPTGHADKAHRCSKHKPYNGWILQWSRPLLQGYRHTERLSWGESFGMDLLVTPTRHSDAANTNPTTGGSYSGPGLYCRASNQAIGRKRTYYHLVIQGSLTYQTNKSTSDSHLLYSLPLRLSTCKLANYSDGLIPVNSLVGCSECYVSRAEKSNTLKAPFDQKQPPR